MALRIITHCYSYLRNITHIEEEMSNSECYTIWLILRTWYIFSQALQQAHWTVMNQQQPTRAPAGVHLGGEDSGAATQNAIYRISLLIITHHYSSLLNSLLIITHHYSNSITHHYAPLHYLSWVKILLRCLKISCHKTMHTQPLHMKIEGGGWPPLDFCA